MYTRIVTAVIALIFSTAIHAKIKFYTPKNDSYISGKTVPVSFRGCKKTPTIFAYDGDSYYEIKAKPHHYKKRWIGEFTLQKKGKQKITIDVICGRRKKNHEVVINAGSHPGEVGAQVALNYIKKKKAEKLKWDWGPAILLHGMSNLVPHTKEGNVLLDYIKRYHAHYQNKGLPKIDWADKCPSALSAFSLSEEHGDGFAWSAVEEVAQFLRTVERNKLGSLDHFGNDTFMAKIFPASIWVDSLMMWGIITLRYGLHVGDKELVDFALDQPLIFGRKMQDRTNGLFYHAWNVDKDRPYPKNGTFWLRGNAWVAASFIDILEMMPKDDIRYSEIKQRFIMLMEGAKRTMMPGYLWDTVMSRPGYGYEETSGSALLAYAFAKGARLGILNQQDRDLATKVFDSVSARLIKTKKGHSMPDISWLTMPYSSFIYKILPKYRDMSYGVGSFLLLSSELSK